MLQWIELLTKQFNSCPGACEVNLYQYLFKKATFVISACLYFIQVNMFCRLLWRHQNKLHQKYFTEVHKLLLQSVYDVVFDKVKVNYVVNICGNSCFIDNSCTRWILYTIQLLSRGACGEFYIQFNSYQGVPAVNSIYNSTLIKGCLWWILYTILFCHWLCDVNSIDNLTLIMGHVRWIL